MEGKKKNDLIFGHARPKKYPPRKFRLKCSKLSNLSNCLLLFPRFFLRLHSTWKDLLKDLLNDFQMSNAAKLLGQELRVAQRGCRREPRRSLSMSLELASSVSFLLWFFFPMYRVIIETKSCTNCDDKREIYDIFCHSSVPTLPMKLEVAIEAKAEASLSSSLNGERIPQRFFSNFFFLFSLLWWLP